MATLHFSDTSTVLGTFQLTQPAIVFSKLQHYSSKLSSQNRPANCPANNAPNKGPDFPSIASLSYFIGEMLPRFLMGQAAIWLEGILQITLVRPEMATIRPDLLILLGRNFLCR